MCVNLYSAIFEVKSTRVLLSLLLFFDCFQLEDPLKNKCLAYQSLSTEEIKGSLALPGRIIPSTGVSRLFNLDQGL